jgi:hypothetical protein
MKEAIPNDLLSHASIIEQLGKCLDRLRERNPILNGLKFGRVQEGTKIASLLEGIAEECGVEFAAAGTVDHKSAFVVGNRVFGVSDGIVFLKEGKSWCPVFMKDIIAMFR